MLKVIAVLFLIFDAIIGIRFFLNVIGVLGTSKYSEKATLIYAIIFITLAITGLYFLFIKHNQKLALWVSIGPWFLMILVMFIAMITSRPN